MFAGCGFVVSMAMVLVPARAGAQQQSAGTKAQGVEPPSWAYVVEPKTAPINAAKKLADTARRQVPGSAA